MHFDLKHDSMQNCTSKEVSRSLEIRARFEPLEPATNLAPRTGLYFGVLGDTGSAGRKVCIPGRA